MLLGKNIFIDNLIIINNYDDNQKLIINNNRIEIDDRYFFQGLIRTYYDIGTINNENIEKVLFNTYINLFLIIEIPFNNLNEIFKQKNRLFSAILNSKKNLIKLSQKYSITNFINFFDKMICNFNYIMAYIPENQNIKLSIKKKKIKKKKDLYFFCNDLIYQIINCI